MSLIVLIVLFPSFLFPSFHAKNTNHCAQTFFFDRFYDSCNVFDTTAIDEVVSFVIGNVESEEERVVEAWHKGLLNMCVGEKRRITSPAEFAYGAEGMLSSEDNSLIEDVLGGSGVIYEVDLIGIEKGVMNLDEVSEMLLEMRLHTIQQHTHKLTFFLLIYNSCTYIIFFTGRKCRSGTRRGCCRRDGEEKSRFQD